MICLDTSIFIDHFRKQNKENSKFWELTEVQEQEVVASVVVKYEVYRGIKSEEQRKTWEKVFKNIKLLPFDTECQEEAVKVFQELKWKNKLIGTSDTFIAATARVNGLKLATTNKKHFSRVKGLELI